MMKKRLYRVLGLFLAVMLGVSMMGCGASGGEGGVPQGEVAVDGEKIVNIGVTDSLTSMNSLTIDQSWINLYAVGLEFLPLVQLDKEMNFQPMLADSITTENNIDFVVHINEKATWSDGTPVTAEDLEYTVRKLSSPVIANATTMLYVFEGIGDDGFTQAGAESISGVKVLDDKTVQFTTKYPISLTTFNNSYASNLRALPKHVLEGYSDEELLTLDWFNHPDVVSGPFMVTDYDTNHFISYTANNNYWMGGPKIDKLNIKIVDGSQIYAGLKSGEIDITHHTMTAIPMDDYESIEALENVDVVYGVPVTNQSVFIQTANVPDVRVRQALLCAIDREQILEQILKGHGEIVDGFLSSASPYFDETMEPVSYDPEKAKQLLAQAGWDGTKTLKFYVSSGDTAFVNAAQVMAAQWAAVGITVEVQLADHATLMSISGSTEYDLFAVQYTYAPIDPYPDVTWLLSGEGSWTGYGNDDIDVAMAATQEAENIEEIKTQYKVVNQKMQEDVPMFSAYVISAQGAINKRLTGVEADVYGFFNNIHNWDIAE